MRTKLFRSEIMGQITECMDSLIQQTRDEQGRATTIFEDMYRKMEIGVAVLVVMMLTMCVMVRRLVGLPLMKCNQSIRQGERFPVEGAAELQTMAETYNKVYLENQEAQVLIRHKAEHDPLTDLLNRGSFEKLLKLHEEGEAPFALFIVDVDCFKIRFNDTCGHAAGDKTLKKVAELRAHGVPQHRLCVPYRRGDEFAIIMVEMTSNLAYTIQEKIDAVNETMTKQEGDGPKVSLSVGVAFSDRKTPAERFLRMRIRRCTNRRTTENADAASMRACRRNSKKPRNTKRKSNKRSPVSKLRRVPFPYYTVPHKRLQATYFTLPTHAQLK